MLLRVYQEIEASQGSLNLNDLKRRLGIERSVLDGMIQVLVQSGYLVREDVSNAADNFTCGGCSLTCTDPINYALVAKIHKTGLE